MLKKTPNFIDITKFYFSQAGASKRPLIKVSLIALLHPIANPFSWYFTALAINHLSSGSFDMYYFVSIVAFVFVSDLVSVICLWLYAPHMHRSLMRTENNILSNSLKHINKLSIGWYTKENGGELIHKLIKGVEGISVVAEKILGNTSHTALRTLISVTMSLIMLGKIIFIIPIIIYIIIVYLVVKKYKKALEEKREKFRKKEKEVYGSVYDITSGFPTIKLAGIGSYFIDKTSKKLDFLPTLRFEAAQIGALRFMIIRFMNALVTSLLFIGGGYLVIHGQAEIGVLVIIFSMTGYVGDFLTDMIQTEDMYIRYRPYIIAMMDLLDQKNMIVDSKGAKNIDNSWKTLKFDNINFSYTKNKKTLQDISLEIKKGKIVGFAGKSGSGKSTLIKLLLRQYDTYKGDILIGEQDIKNIKQKSLFESISYLPQDVEIFDMSIRENITLGMTKKDIKLKEIYGLCGLTDFIASLKDKEKTLVGPRGIKLSGGERQRLGLARALYKNSDIYIFDESTSQLDAILEEEIMKKIKNYLAGKTLILVAHRLSTILDSDQIYLFEDGHIIESGELQAMKKPKTKFYEYLKKQNIV